MNARITAAADAVKAELIKHLDQTGDRALNKADVEVLVNRGVAKFHEEQTAHPTAVLVAGCALSGVLGMFVGYVGKLIVGC